MQKKFYGQMLRTIIICFLLCCMMLLFKYTIPLIYPFLIAILIAYWLHPVVTYMEKEWKMNRGFAITLVICSFFTFLFTALYFLMKQLLRESMDLLDTLPIYFGNIKEVLVEIGQTYLVPGYEKIISFLPFLPLPDEIKIETFIHHVIDHLNTSSAVFMKNTILATSTIISSITYVGTIFLFILLASFIITKDSDNLRLYCKKIIPLSVTRHLRNMMTHLKKSVFGFVKAQVIIACITALFVCIGLFIFRIENVFTVSLTIFFVDFIPYVGIGVIFIPWIIYQFFKMNYVLTIQLAVLYIVLIMMRQVMEPRILASGVGIHPLVAIILLFVGIQSLGVVGIFVTPFILIAISAIYHTGMIHKLFYFIRDG